MLGAGWLLVSRSVLCPLRALGRSAERVGQGDLLCHPGDHCHVLTLRLKYSFTRKVAIAMKKKAVS
jgi:hypothetical protein